MVKKWYSISEIIDIAVKDYSLYTTSENYRNNYRAVFVKCLDKDLTIYKTAHTEIRGKSKTKVFSEKQKQLLFSSKRVYDYITKNSKDEKIKNRKSYDELMKESENRREAYIEYMGNDNRHENDVFIGYTQLEVERVKIKMMIEALFNHFFSEFKEELLEHDLNACLLEDELNLTPDVIQAEERLKNPYGNYYSLKTTKFTP